ncbi:MAG: NnrS family protein [Gallionellaceae bacterium]|nr:NnrS family protein [Gallionellaceae bacterium]
MSYWKSFTAAPHRVMFFGGALQALAVMLWWLIELATRYGFVGQQMEWSIAPTAAHSFLMIYGMLPFFMFGFLMTVFPRWMGGKELTAESFVPACILLMVGAVGFYIGLIASNAILIFAVLSTLVGWGLVLHALSQVWLAAPKQDKRHPSAIFVALVMGWLGIASYLVWLMGASDTWLRFSVQSGLWLFLLPVFASVGHRMIPFFSNGIVPPQYILRPFWPWPLLLVGGGLHFALQFSEATDWLWLSDLPMLLAAFYLTYAWGFRHSLRNPLLAILHIGFAWIGIALLLSTLQSAALLFSHGEIFILGLAPLHALTIGCFATLMLGMGTRVTLGHSGLPFDIDTSLKLMFVGMQLVAVLRVSADMLPLDAMPWLYCVAALIWLVSFTPWVWRYLPAYWRPRADGRPG